MNILPFRIELETSGMECVNEDTGIVYLASQCPFCGITGAATVARLVKEMKL